MTKIQMVELELQYMRSGFYVKTEQTTEIILCR